jgi:hypothetical protein
MNHSPHYDFGAALQDLTRVAMGATVAQRNNETIGNPWLTP